MRRADSTLVVDGVAVDGPVVGRFRDSIAGQITIRSLLLAAIPVVLVGLLTVTSLFVLNGRAVRGLESAREDLAAETIGSGRAQQAQLVLVRMDDFVAERIDDVIDWSEAEVLVEAAGADRPEIESYVSLPVEQVEEAFDGNDQLDTTGVSSRFLVGQLTDRPAFAELFFTDANGFNVGASNPTSDFVQRDEEWWQTAWTDGAFVGPLVFDESANVFSFEIALRIEAQFGRPVGVIKAVVDATALQTFADEFATEGSGGVQVRVLNTDGLLLAETATDHDPSRIGEQVLFEGDQTRSFQVAVAAAEGNGSSQQISSGFVLLDDTVAGFSATSATRPIERLGIETPVQQWVTIVEQPAQDALAPLEGIEQLQSDLSLSARTLAVVVLALIALAVGASIFVSRLIARRIALPISQLQAQAHRVANDELPSLVASLQAPGRVGRLPEVDPIEIEAQGEVADLAEAFNSVRSTAVHLAASQTIGRTRDVAAILVNLGRRNQQLIGRQLEFIDQLERSESDPANLQNLFQLDQMATRMRRNAESLLVLAGEESRHRGTEPVPVTDVIRASISEVEDYERVEITDAVPVMVSPKVAGDLGHLLAELIENAANYSPPDTKVEIIGTAGPDNTYTISVLDHGIGMPRSELAAANEQIREPVSTEDASTSRLGLLVVGRLANRHKIDARLIESATQGLTAKITLPSDLLVDRATRDSRPGVVDDTQRLAQEIIGTLEPGREAVLTARPRQPKTVTVEDRPDLPSPPTRPSVPEPVSPPATGDHDLDAVQALPAEACSFRRRTRRAPSTGDQHIEHSLSPVDEDRTSVSEARAVQVQEMLSRYTIGLEAGNAHPPTEPRASHERALTVRDHLAAFTEGLKRGQSETESNDETQTERAPTSTGPSMNRTPPDETAAPPQQSDQRDSE